MGVVAAATTVDGPPTKVLATGRVGGGDDPAADPRLSVGRSLQAMLENRVEQPLDTTASQNPQAFHLAASGSAPTQIPRKGKVTMWL